MAPTCTAAGYTAHKDCSRCTYVEGKEAVAALGHKFFAGACTVCEAADPDYNAYLLNFSQWPEFAKETYADGDIFKYNDIFTFIMSKNSRVDGSEKTWDDFTGTLRFSFGGKTPTGAVPTKNALQITVDGAYTIKIWYVAGGDARYFALMDAEGTVLSETTKETVKNGQYYAELVIPAAGTYYFGVPGDNNYIFQIELVKHEHQYGEGVVTAPTCTEAGYTTYTCSCGHSYTDSEVAALGHKYEAAVTAPTCTEAGYTTYTCACGDTYTGDEVAALGHTFVYGKCAVCGAADPEYVPYVNTLVVGDTNKIVVDGDTFNDYNLPIEWVAFVADEKATYTFVGDNGALVFIFDAELNLLCGGTGTATLEAGTYLICIGNGLVGELNVAVTKTALPHEHVWSEATCTEPAKCECGETQGEALDHTFAEGLCTVCGAEDPDYVPEQPPVDEPTEEPKDEPTTEEPDALAKVWDMILKLLAWVMGFFKNLFVKA